MSAELGSPVSTRALQISFGGHARSFRIFDTALCEDTCRAVFSDKTYPLAAIQGEIKTVVDVGANVGAATVYFALRYPQARIYAFEPSPESYQLLLANTSDLAYVSCFGFGLFDENRQAMLYRGREDLVTSTIGRSPEATDLGNIVTLRDAATALTECGIDSIDILKIDTEGCELPILHSLAEFLPRTGILFVEYHSERDRRELDSLLIGTHALLHAEITHPCRGELCYMARRCLPASLDAVYDIQPD